MEAQTKILELRAIEKELMELEKWQAKLIRRRRELLELCRSRADRQTFPSRDVLREQLREAAGLTSAKKRP